MLAALVVIVLAAAFALVAVAAGSGVHAVETADAAGWRADVIVGEALGEVGDRLRWSPGLRSGTAAGSGETVAGESWSAAWSPAPAVGGDVWPRVRARVEARSGRAVRRADVGLELRAEVWAHGVVCAGDVAVAAPLVVSGSGVYVGGSLRGRELVGFAQGAGPATPAGVPADHVHGELFPEAAVHAVAAIFAHGAEIHEAPEAPYWPYDTDLHTSGADAASCVARPSAEFLTSAVAHSVPLSDAMIGATLRLDALDVPGSESGTALGGRCVTTPPIDTAYIAGRARDDGGRLLVVVPGDAVLGDVGGETVFTGALVVYGNLEVRGSTSISGSVYAGSLLVSAPLRVTLAPDWRQDPLAGACLPAIRELGI
jgi:hypothetical protein